MLDLNMYTTEEIEAMTRNQLQEAIIVAQTKCDSEFKRAVFWEKECRKEEKYKNSIEGILTHFSRKVDEIDIERSKVDCNLDRHKYNKLEAIISFGRSMYYDMVGYAKNQ